MYAQEPESGRMSAVQELTLDRARAIVEQLKDAVKVAGELGEIKDSILEGFQSQIASYALSLRTSKLNPDELESFFKKPYAILPAPGRQDTWYLIVPRFIDKQWGWLERQSESFNYFLVNRYVDWLGELPEEIKRQLGWKTPLELHLEGDILKGPTSAMEAAWHDPKYKHFFTGRENSHIVVNKKRSFELLATLIKDGILPFDPKPIDPSLFCTPRKCGYEPLRPYQVDAYEVLKLYSNIGVFFPASTGKTVVSIYAMTRLKPPHLVVVPKIILKEQWEGRIETQTDLKLNEEVFVVTYQTAIKKMMNREWTLVTIDETHHLPADNFSKISFFKRRCTLGLTASPNREDKREEYIFALTGKPVGLGWEHFRKLGLIKSPVCHVWILRNFEAKLRMIKSLLDRDVKTLIFSDSIEIGKTVSSRFNAPFVYGATKEDRLKTLEEAKVAVVSRVGDEGISLPDVGLIIEVSWLYGSRAQELQRFTRLLHGHEAAGEGEYHILMTVEEYLHDRKRLFSVMDKGFKVEIHKEGVSDKAMEEAPRPRPQRAPTSTTATAIMTATVPTGVTAPQPSIPLPPLDERDQVNAGLIAGLLKTAYAKNKQGLTVGEMREILDASHIKYSLNALSKLIQRMFQRRRIDGRREGERNRRYFVKETFQ